MHEKVVVCELLGVEGVAGKDKLKAISVSDGSKTYSIVTNAPNVTEDKVGQRLVVALEGAEDIPGVEGTVGKARVGGVLSEGMLCDGKMLWGGSAGTAVFLDDDHAVGGAPPASRPRPKQAGEAPPPIAAGEGLFAKKLSKEEKKAAAKAAKEARKAKKAGAAAAPAPAAPEADDDDAATVVDAPPAPPTPPPADDVAPPADDVAPPAPEPPAPEPGAAEDAAPAAAPPKAASLFKKKKPKATKL